MTQFNRILSGLPRLHPKYREHLRCRIVTDPTWDTAVTHRKCSCKRCYLVPKFTVEDVQSSTDTLVGEFELEDKDKEEDEIFKADVVEEEVHEVDPPTDPTVNTADEAEEDEEDENVSELFQYDLAQKMRHEKITPRLYVASTDNDDDIADLCTHRGAKFTHIVRVTFEPPSNNIKPSNWAVEKIRPNDGPSEMHLMCPAYTRHHDELTALNVKQLQAARRYITYALELSGFESPAKEWDYAKVLIVGPPDRSVDIMAILDSYLDSLSGDELLAYLQRVNSVHEYWMGDAMEGFDMFNETSKPSWHFW